MSYFDIARKHGFGLEEAEEEKIKTEEEIKAEEEAAAEVIPDAAAADSVDDAVAAAVANDEDENSTASVQEPAATAEQEPSATVDPVSENSDALPGSESTDNGTQIPVAVEGEPVQSSSDDKPAEPAEDAPAAAADGSGEPGATATGEGEGAPATTDPLEPVDEDTKPIDGEELPASDKSVLEAGDEDSVKGIIAQAADGFAVGLSETKEAAEEVAEASAAVDRLEKTGTALERYLEVAEVAASRRGLDRSSVIALGIGLESLLDEFGVDVSKVMPSLEHFGLEEERKESTGKFADRIKSMLASLLKALVSAYRSLITKSKSWLATAKGWHPMLMKRIADAGKAIDSYSGDLSSELSVPSALRKKLYVGENGDVSLPSSDSDIFDLKMILAMSSVSDQVLADRKEVITKLASSDIKALVSALTIDKNIIESYRAVANDGGAKVAVPSGFELVASTPEVAGGKSVIVATGSDDKVLAGVRDVRPEDNFDTDASVSGISKPALKSLVGYLESIVSKSGDIIRAREAAMRATDDMLRALDNIDVETISKDAEEGSVEELTTAITAFKKELQIEIKMTTSVMTDGLSYALSNVVPSWLQFIGLVLKKSSTKEATPEEESTGNEAFEEGIDGVGNEGWKGGLLGFLISTPIAVVTAGLSNTPAGVALKGEVERKNKEIEALAKGIQKLATENGRQAVKEGKMSADDLKKNIESVGFWELVKGGLWGTLFGSLYATVKSSELEDKIKELKAKTQEYEALLEQVAAEQKKEMAGK